MCGRFAFYTDPQLAWEQSAFDESVLTFQPRYNIAPTQNIVTVTNNGHRRLELMRWGLIPFWAKDLKVSYRMINAVGETLASKPAFRTAFRNRRCLILADGFFEWRKEGKNRIPHYILLKSRKPFAFAGLWGTWQSPLGLEIKSCTIVTTNANKLIKPIHHRMPAILSLEAAPLWIDPLTEDPEILQPLLLPSPSEEMDLYEVSSYVNSPHNDGLKCIRPL